MELHGPQSQGDIIEEWIDAIRNNIRILNEREAFQMNEVIGAITKVNKFKHCLHAFCTVSVPDHCTLSFGTGYQKQEK